MNNTIRVLGIDPSLRNFGMAVGTYNIETGGLVVDEFHIAQTAEDKSAERKSYDDYERARLVSSKFADVMSSCEIAVAEIPIGSQSARAMASYGISIGVVAGCTLPLVKVHPLEVKKGTVGSNGASKREVIDWAYKLHPEAPWPMRKSGGKMVVRADAEHFADAVGVLEVGIRKPEFKAQVMQILAERREAA